MIEKKEQTEIASEFPIEGHLSKRNGRFSRKRLTNLVEQINIPSH